MKPLLLTKRGVFAGALSAMLWMAISPSVYAQKENKKSHKEWYEYDKVVTLTGTLVKKWHYGPPGYGENPKEDRVIHYLALKLDPPINMKEDTTKEFDYIIEENVRVVELFGVDKEEWQKLSPFVGKKVTFKGRLYHKERAIEFTDVLLEIIWSDTEKQLDVNSG
jgi:hypothetical protein